MSKTQITAVLVDEVVSHISSVDSQATVKAARDCLAGQLERHASKHFHFESKKPIAINQDPAKSFIPGISYEETTTIAEVSARRCDDQFPLIFCLAPKKTDALGDRVRNMVVGESIGKYYGEGETPKKSKKHIPETQRQILEILKDHEKRISSQATEISSQAAEISSHAAEISSQAAEISSLVAEVATLKVLNDTHEERNILLERTLNEHTRTLRKIHFRSLENEVREGILRHPYFSEYRTWNDLRDELSVDDLGTQLRKQNVFSQALLPKALHMVYFDSEIRIEGNQAAHRVTREEVREAILAPDTGISQHDRHLLKNLYSCRYNEAI